MSAQAFIGLADAEQGTSLWQDAWRRLRRNRLAVCGLIVVVAFIVVALLTPWIAPFGYAQQNLELGATPPSAAHWLGTDIFGRDLLTHATAPSASGPARRIRTSCAATSPCWWSAPTPRSR